MTPSCSCAASTKPASNSPPRGVDTPQAMSAALRKQDWDIAISDYSMPRFSGIAALKLLKDSGLDIPFIFVSGTIGEETAIAAMRQGARDYMMKGDAKRLVPAVERELREAAARRARRQAEEELALMSRLKRYFAPQVVESILKTGNEGFLESHRREITAVFLDLRGFTAFSDSAEPEEMLSVLRSYYAEMGKLVFKHEGTLEHFAGDGCMVFFNDPLPCEDHVERAVRMSLEMRERAGQLRAGWRKKGYDLHLGIGLAVGYATLGNIGFEDRMEYGAVGNVVNLASRLSSEARGGQILTNQKTLGRIEELAKTQPLGEVHVKGFVQPVAVFNILGLRE